MKKDFVKRIIAAIMAAAALALLGCAPADKPAEEKGDSLFYSEAYAESTERVLNPDVGFYRTYPMKLTAAGGAKSGIYGDYRLHHLRVDLSAFSAAGGGADTDITDAALSHLDAVLSELKAKEKSVIIRFAYDGFNGLADREPSEARILSHIGQLCAVLDKYADTLTAVEAGMVGKWGEMHSSRLANYDTIDKIIDAFLSGLKNTPVLVRTPRMIYHYLGITLDEADGCEIKAGDKAYRLGLFNDGYLGSETDLGTYTDRARETKWLEKQTAHLPYGGEVMTGEMSDIDKCLAEMRFMHLSYLNYEWNYNTTQDKWAKTKYTSACGGEKAYYGLTAARYIENHLGYRFVLRSARVDGCEKATLKLNVENIGFGAPTRRVKAKIILVGGGKTLEYPAPDFAAGKYEASFVPPEGEYELYLCAYCGTGDGVTYAIEFANTDIYDGALKANKIGTVTF